MADSEISPQEDPDDAPLRLESMPTDTVSHSSRTERKEDGAASDLSSTLANTYSSFTSLLTRSATDISEATKKLPSQFQNLAHEGSGMFKGLTHFISHGLSGTETHFEQPDFQMLKKTFGLSNSDSLIGSFVCELQQRYHPIDNTLSPNIQISFPVLISVTEEAMCITVEHDGHEYPGKISREELLSLSSDSDMLMLKMTDDRQVILKNFGRSESKVMAFKLIKYLMPK